jgi:hypothetical protein
MPYIGPHPYQYLRDRLGRRHVTPSKGVGTFERASTVIGNGNDGIGVAGGWIVGSGTGSLETTNVRRPGVSVLKALTFSAAADQFMTVRRKFPATALNGNLEFWFYLPPLSAGTRYMQIAYSSDTPAADPPNALPANRRRINYNSDQYPSGGWHCLQIHKDGKLYSSGTPGGTGWSNTGSPDAGEIEFIEIVFGCSADVPAAERYFLLDQVAVNGKGRPVIIIGCDGGYPSHRTQFLPLMQARGMLGYNAIDGEDAAGSRADLLPLYEAGFDIPSQGIGHINYATNPSSLAPDIASAEAYLLAEGYTRGRGVFMFPLNSRSAANSDTLEAAGFRMGAANTQQLIPASSLGRPNLNRAAGRLGIEGVGVTFTGRWKAWIDEAVLSGKSLILIFHDLVTTASGSSETTLAEFILLLDYIAALRDAGSLRVMTPSQYAAAYG